MEKDVGLLPIVHTLDALFELSSRLPSPMPPEDAVPLLGRARVLGVLALQRLSEEEGTVLQRLLHPDFFDLDKDSRDFVARASIAVLRGFVHGCIQQRQVQEQVRANAEAYAVAKLKEERGIGFQR